MKTVKQLAQEYVEIWLQGRERTTMRDIACDKLAAMPAIVAASVVAEMTGILRASYPDQLPLLRGRLEDAAQRALRFVFES